MAALRSWRDTRRRTRASAPCIRKWRGVLSTQQGTGTGKRRICVLCGCGRCGGFVLSGMALPGNTRKQASSCNLQTGGFEEKETDPFCDLPTEMPALKTHKIENYTFWDENVCTRCVRGMMRADLVRDIRYDEQIAIGEDALFMVQALLRTKGYVCVPCALYAYYIRPDSAIHQSDFSPKQYSEITTWENLCLGGKTAGQYEPYSGGAVRGGLRPCILPDGGQRPCRSGAASQDRADGARALAGGLASPEQQEA